jgi:hypothetical protein
MRKKKNTKERYHEYILAIVEVGEITTAHELQQRLFEFDPNEYAGRQARAFHHKEMPTTAVIGWILGRSPNFEKTERASYWRRTE